MDADRWHQVKELLASALEQPPDLGPAFLDAACADDSALRAEVDALLRADAEAVPVMFHSLADLTITPLADRS